MNTTTTTTEILQVEGEPVSTEEMELATAIMEAFNKANGSDYRLTRLSGKPTAELGHLIRVIREAPEVGIAEHRLIIERNFDNPWWSEPKAGSVAAIYGDRTWPRCRVNNGIRPNRSGRTARLSIDRAPNRAEQNEPEPW
jgi:hypothetical protein